MKLLTHNLMQSHVKGVKNGYPLLLQVSEKKINEIEFNPDFVTRMLTKIDWSVLKNAAQQCFQMDQSSANDFPSIPDQVPDVPSGSSGDSSKYDEQFLKLAHHLMMEVEVTEGYLICPESGRKFKITRGIPNMLLTDQDSK